MEEVYFSQAQELELTNEQDHVIAGIRHCITTTKPANLEASGTRAELDAVSSLRLTMTHRRNPEVRVVVTIDDEGEISVSSPTLHSTFLLRYNLRWEPEEAQGTLADALEVICGLIEGRVQSEILWGGGNIARSRDILIGVDNARHVLYTQYHADGLLGAIIHRRHEIRRVGFV